MIMTLLVIIVSTLLPFIIKVQSATTPVWNKYRGNSRDTGSTTLGTNAGADGKGVVGWKFASSGAIISSPACGDDGTLFFGSDDRNFYAINGSNGYLKWSARLYGFVDSSPAVSQDGKSVYVGCNVQDELLSLKAQKSTCCLAGEGQLCPVPVQ